MLTEWPLLIVFDNFESQLDERRAFLNEDLRVFLTTLVRATATGSRFLFTTRYLFDLDGERLGHLQELPLGDLSRPEALMMMQKLRNLAQAAHRDKLAVMEKFGGHPYALVTLDWHCSQQPLDQALQDASSLESELREFLAIELNYRRLSDRARELLNRLAAFRNSVPLAAAEWVMGERFPHDATEFLRKNRDNFLDELEAIGEVALLQKLHLLLPQMRRLNNVDVCIEELIDLGLLLPRVAGGELQSLVIHNLVRDFCRDQPPRETWHAQLVDAVAFYASVTDSLQQSGREQEATWCDLDAFDLLIEAGNWDAAAALLLHNHKLLDRWGFINYLIRQYQYLLGKVSASAEGPIRHNLGKLTQRGQPIPPPALGRVRCQRMLNRKSSQRILDTRNRIG